ncbi:hypothetical protein O0I10_002347 [Lichtheimia ornata]|uniref:AMP-dependent synthetase/ligase domain-containing protein n=1 Tax=Lichtheimia ornata TaxID=688661 RepID=A0AAD7Y1W2_9FUNG|nr:uncharacterized protein O0I10_002347 [Lichtheimia ornata]KAJ8662016.1 hypothetical protein O0I10_002347 [Lichtheimia ornata]
MLSSRPSVQANQTKSYYHAIFENNPDQRYAISDTEPLLIDGDNPERHYSFQQLRQHVLTFSAVLRDEQPFNVKRGDLITLYVPNDIDFMVAMHGIMAAGAIAAGLPIECKSSQEVADLCKQACPTLAVVHASTLETMKDALAACMMTDIKIVVIGQDAKHDPKNGIHSLHKLIEQPRGDAEAMVMDPKEIAFTISTSGTTGPCKLAAISHGVAASRIDFVSSRPLITNKAHSYMPCRSMSLLSANAITNLGIQQRARALVCKIPLSFEKMCALIENFKVENTLASLWTLHDFIQSSMVDKYDLSSLKGIFSGGQHVSVAVMEAVKARVNADVNVNYGSTESWSVLSRSTADATHKGYESKLLLPRENLRVVDEDGNDAAVGQPGELWVKSHLAASGYYNNPEATAKAFREDGYYRTGDYFVVDNNGNYQYRGRMSDRIRAKGRTFPSAFLEDLCYQYSDDIKECCVVGGFSERLGCELPRAYVVLVENSEKDQQAFIDGLVSYVNNRVPQAEMELSGGAKCLKKLPLTKSDKVDRYKLRGIAQEEIN